MRHIENTVACVVGGAGFLGSHLVDYLIKERQCKVLVLDNLVSGRKEFLHSEAEFVHCDITQSESRMRHLFQNFGVKYVWNYSAIPYIPVSFERPLYVFSINAMGALQVINAAQEAGVEGILQVSSAEIYGCTRESFLGSNEPVGRIDEDMPIEPHSSYGVAKAAIDAMVQVRWKEAKTPVIALRQFNCIGERDILHPYVVPEIARQLNHFDHMEEISCGSYGESTGHTPTIYLGNNSFRDFLYAGDQAVMATELLEKGNFGEVYNLGSEEGVKIYDLARMISSIMGYRGTIIEEDPSRKRPWEIWHLQSDNSKIYSVIQSRPKVSLQEALKRTIDYYEETNWKFPW